MAGLFDRELLLAAEPSNGRCITRAPSRWAICTVASVDCESTTTISSQNASEARQSPMRSASLNVIMQAEMAGAARAGLVDDGAGEA